MDANAPTHVDANAHLATSQVASGVSATVAHVQAHADHLDLVDQGAPHDRGDHTDLITLDTTIDHHHLMRLTISRGKDLHLDIHTLINRGSTSQREMEILEAGMAKQ